MKVGVDGVLLGAWAKAINPGKILDIGTGTGLIALMLTQRFQDAEVLGVEIDQAAFKEAAFNFEQSPFSDRCSAIHTAIQDFKTDEKFDLIVSNPPYFEAHHLHNSPRSLARQQSELNFIQLLKICSDFLSSTGVCAFIIPFSAENQFLKIADDKGLFLQKLTRVRGNPDVESKRILIQFSKNQTESEIDELIIELSRNVYSEEYKKLCQDFYLKF